MTIGEMIRNKRKEAKITQQELGEILGVSSQMIAQYENDKRKPKIETLRKICKAMNITVGELGGDIWSYYSSKELAEDWTIRTNKVLSELPEQMDSLLKRALKNTSETIQNSAERLRKHPHEIVDSDLRAVKLLYSFEKLNTTGKDEAVSRIEELTEIKKYTEPDKE